MPIIAIVLALGTPHARVNGPAFAVGWLTGLSAVGAVVLVVIGNNATQDSGEPVIWASVLELGFGILFLLMAARLWRGRPRPGKEAEMPKWVQAVDHFSARKSLGIGVLLPAANPKNLVLTIAAATAIARTATREGRRPSRWPSSFSSAR